MDRYWVAVVICRNEETGQTHASFLTFWARNRFYALEAVRNMLPERSEYVDAFGKLRPFRFIELKPIRENEAILYQGAFLEMFSNSFDSGDMFSPFMSA